ncbi:MAG: nucleotidyltransferase domain-containing protein [Candidatus Bathyarchaeota archaeon]|nr:nucleotidyltransferase domain-containing protein [Candidatus Bathyarchaeota archaeon]
MANIKLRDRDAIQTVEGLIFRVFGYSHPNDAYICDAEYASQNIFKSTDPRAPRTAPNQTFYKFYNDEGMKLVSTQFQKYAIYHEMLRQKVVGVHLDDIYRVRKPEERLQELIHAPPKDELVEATLNVLKVVTGKSGLKARNFGVFGSMLHNFHHPKYSDIDLTVYGKKENKKIRKTLQALYKEKNSHFHNEFESVKVMAGKQWRFKNFTVKDFVWHQRRKQIYGLYDDEASGRTIKTEFEPVKAWDEIKSEYDPQTTIKRKGWVKLKARVKADDEAPFIPSIYGIEPLKVLDGPKEALEAKRIFSFMEEFRLQAEKDETVIVEGNLEEVASPKSIFLQVTLTYCPRYYDQVLKVIH